MTPVSLTVSLGKIFVTMSFPHNRGGVPSVSEQEANQQ
jgi:hypothetical protein